jgi:transcriptional regulator with XRE-family HTH domain
LQSIMRLPPARWETL